MSKKEPLVELFRVGDIVRLKSGGRKAVVTNVWQTNYEDCVRIRIAYSTKKGRIYSDDVNYKQEVFEKVEEKS